MTRTLQTPVRVPANEGNDPTITSRHMLGFDAHPGTIQDYLELIETAIKHSSKITVLYHNLHSLYSYFTSDELRRCYEKCIALVDGMPVIWLLKLGGHPVNREQRITYVDFIWPMLERARDRQWRVFHLGQSSEVQNQALAIIRSRLPELIIEGHDGYFDLSPDSQASNDVIGQINEFRTDLLLVGFGAPKQEYWVNAHREKIDAPALFTCGACMEYIGGAVKTPPRWLGKAGLEWSYRLFENPRRFAFRYLVEPVLLGAILLRNLILPSGTRR